MPSPYAVRLRTPDVWVNAAEHRLRSGRRTVEWRDLQSAELIVAAQSLRGKRTLILVLRDSAGVRVPLLLRRRERLGLTAAGARLAWQVVYASSIAMPRAKEDPTGKFSRWNFPTHVSKADALDLIARPPAPGDALPTP